MLVLHVLWSSGRRKLQKLGITGVQSHHSRPTKDLTWDDFVSAEELCLHAKQVADSFQSGDKDWKKVGFWIDKASGRGSDHPDKLRTDADCPTSSSGFSGLEESRVALKE